MRTRLFQCGVTLTLPPIAGIVAILASVAFLAPGPHAYAQSQDPFMAALNAANAKASGKKDKSKHAASGEALQPTFAIPVTPLGFAPPAAFYLGDRFVQASLDFLDEDNLLFTFRVPGLIPREPPTPGQPQHDQRHIRALTLSLPSGKVTAEAMWVLHDYSRYLWKMKDGKFLLRDRNTLQLGDSSLHLEPFLRFPGLVSFIELDPDQRWLVADTNEPPQSGKNPGSSQGSSQGSAGDTQDAQTASLSSSPASMTVDGSGGQPGPDGPDPHPDLGFQKAQSDSEGLLRILRLDTRKVMLFSRVNGTVHLPIDGEGYYDALRGNGRSWMINFEHFNGATNPIGWVESSCNPALQVLSHGIVLASACNDYGARHLTALSRDRDKEHAHLWDVTLAPTKIWPILESSSDGLRVARETLEVTHAVGPYNPLDDSDIRGQSVQVYDLATGRLALTVPASPVLDGGGNFALSPSGDRLAILNAGSIQVYDLPPAPPIPPQPAAPIPAPAPAPPAALPAAPSHP